MDVRVKHQRAAQIKPTRGPQASRPRTPRRSGPRTAGQYQRSPAVDISFKTLQDGSAMRHLRRRAGNPAGARTRGIRNSLPTIISTGIDCGKLGAPVDVRAHRTPRKREKQATTFEEWMAGLNLSFSQEDLVAALDDMTRSSTASGLSWHDRSFWEVNSGIKDSDAAVASASAANAAARVLLDASAATAEEVAKRMRLSASTIRHYKAAKKLYSYLVNGKLAFPGWQFNGSGDRSIPSLENVLAVMPEDLHPQTVAGFFLTPQPDLVLHGEPVSAKEWLEAGGSDEPVVELAEGLAAGY